MPGLGLFRGLEVDVERPPVPLDRKGNDGGAQGAHEDLFRVGGPDEGDVEVAVPLEILRDGDPLNAGRRGRPEPDLGIDPITFQGDDSRPGIGGDDRDRDRFAGGEGMLRDVGDEFGVLVDGPGEIRVPDDGEADRGEAEALRVVDAGDEGAGGLRRQGVGSALGRDGQRRRAEVLLLPDRFIGIVAVPLAGQDGDVLFLAEGEAHPLHGDGMEIGIDGDEGEGVRAAGLEEVEPGSAGGGVGFDAEKIGARRDEDASPGGHAPAALGLEAADDIIEAVGSPVEASGVDGERGPAFLVGPGFGQIGPETAPRGIGIHARIAEEIVGPGIEGEGGGFQGALSGDPMLRRRCAVEIAEGDGDLEVFGGDPPGRDGAIEGGGDLHPVGKEFVDPDGGFPEQALPPIVPDRVDADGVGAGRGAFLRRVAPVEEAGGGPADPLHLHVPPGGIADGDLEREPFEAPLPVELLHDRPDVDRVPRTIDAPVGEEIGVERGGILRRDAADVVAGEVELPVARGVGKEGKIVPLADDDGHRLPFADEIADVREGGPAFGIGDTVGDGKAVLAEDLRRGPRHRSSALERDDEDLPAVVGVLLHQKTEIGDEDKPLVDIVGGGAVALVPTAFVLGKILEVEVPRRAEEKEPVSRRGLVPVEEFREIEGDVVRLGRIRSVDLQFLDERFGDVVLAEGGVLEGGILEGAVGLADEVVDL